MKILNPIVIIILSWLLMSAVVGYLIFHLNVSMKNEKALSEIINKMNKDSK